ncbi:ferredoxin [Patescibacteria group bacterium]|nr:ferredoxin [Patescibacteria group bacterium]
MKIIHEREKCIGCGSCAAICPKYWEMAEDGKAKLLEAEATPQKGNYELEIKEIECNQEAADACPVECIHIIK